MKIILIAFLLCANIVNAQVTTGKLAPEISLPNAKNEIVNLSSFKGKVVLIDFWASWCGPCRQSIPEVKWMYKNYKSKGFEVYGISLDAKKKDWLKAVKQDRITYTQVNDKMGWVSPVAQKYGVNQIPTTFLLDKNGVVVAIDAEGVELKNKIEELLKR